MSDREYFRDRRRAFPRNRFLDGCHRYGWLIGIAAQVLIVGMFAGKISQSIDDLRERVFHIEERVDKILELKK